MPRPGAAPDGPRPIWYRSFYWRIAVSFIALVIVVLVGQSLMFSVLLTRSQNAFAPGNPNTLAAAVAAEVGAALAAAPEGSLDAVVRRSGARQAIYVLLTDGREAQQRRLAAPAGDSRPDGRRADRSGA